MRFEDSPGLFGCGIGTGTVGMVECEWCGAIYNVENEAGDGDVIDATIDSTGVVWFGGKQICDCCFEKIEQAVLDNMDDILPWYRRIIEVRKKHVNKNDENLKAVGA